MSTRAGVWRVLLLAWIAGPVSAAHGPVRSGNRPAPAESTSQDPTAEWKLETLELTDGTIYAGLIQAEHRHEIEFVEIRRPPGKPMFALVRPIDPKSVADRHRLDAADRSQLIERFQEFRKRARIEAGRMEDVTLRDESHDGARRWIYDGDWFTLESRADAALTRRCIVRIEQVFRAYRQLLPPRVQPPTALRILLFGSMDDYRAFVDQLGLKIETPGLFVSAQNLIVAGSDLELFARRLAQVRAENERVRRQYEAFKAEFPKRLEVVSKELQQKGFDAAEIEQELKLRTTVWQREHDTALSRLDRLEQQNDAKFAEVTRQMFARLYHEAFHAYAENFVFPQRHGGLPRWLNEGLAQVFESGQLDGDSLRVDAPDHDRLTRLQAELRSDQPLALIDVLNATENDFLTSHWNTASQRRYLYSWGLAYHLAFHQNLLTSRALETYVSNQDGYGPAARFTRVVNLPLDKFEHRWRQAMLDARTRN
jgi:hypothetical protein